MNKIGIRKVSVLQGMAKDIAEAHDLEPNDLVIVTVSLEKVIGAPVSYLLKQIESSDKTQTHTPAMKVCEQCDGTGWVDGGSKMPGVYTCGVCRGTGKVHSLESTAKRDEK